MENNDTPVKKKRGRKPKNVQPVENTEPVVPKKRGRKPKGGKLITKINENNENPVEISNVILHLKCSIKDIVSNTNSQLNTNNEITYNPNVPPSVEYFNNDKTNYTEYINEMNEIKVESNNTDNNNNDNNTDNHNNITVEDEDPNKTLTQKLKILKMRLYKNDNVKKSACFWCTYNFDNVACYIPIQDNLEDVSGYGSFCRPECAAAYLMKQNLDDSTKFERYHLLNKYYGKIFEYTKSIKPAPDPYYTLDKFYGNLNIKEYRKLLKSDHMLITLEKPFSKSLPELHEENDTLVTDIYGGGNPNKQNNGMYKVKRESEKQKGPSKSIIIQEQFGLNN
jgi:hypothetical protein